ncbi:hypothetical protein phiPsa347_117 [Pseudomonas phage phiPsa347]|uniref:Uncharacterized protein n=1 Tax=Pseudomonas phage phiPsa347 TaxID=1460364 RepID=A0A7G9V2I0_9CAUD|nr:hypothetical protein QGX18_gp111 [Pseudomonas phage phiPsa347]QNO00486.1 hypothetical protein phiPsa347_117 [Pseudomonas phage phiPsa347]
MKTLFVLVSNGGDGSYYPHYTLNAKYIQHLEDKYESGEMDYEDLGCDGDGFHYDTLQVPDDFTLTNNGGDIAEGWVPGQDEDEEDE